MRRPPSQIIVGLLVVLSLFVFSFHLPALFFRTMATGISGHPATLADYTTKTGAHLAVISLFGPFMLNFAGLANPLMIVGCVLLFLQKRHAAIWCFVGAVLFALQTFQLLITPYYEDEGGVLISHMMHPLVGWYCWFGSMVLALILAILKLEPAKVLVIDHLERPDAN